jgi:hypothetical protein
MTHRLHRHLHLLLPAAVALAACAPLQKTGEPAPVVDARPPAATPAAAPPEPPAAPPPPAPPPPPVSVLELASRPAERALLAGLRAYDEGQYAQAEQRLLTALKLGLAAPRDRAAAHKTLAFVYCTSQRLKPCEAAFRAARAADPGFALSKAEAGHPTWGPVYRRTLDPR